MRGQTTQISRSNDHILDLLPNFTVLVFKRNLLVGTALKDYIVLATICTYLFLRFLPHNPITVCGLDGEQSDRGIQHLSRMGLWERETHCWIQTGPLGSGCLI